MRDPRKKGKATRPLRLGGFRLAYLGVFMPRLTPGVNNDMRAARRSSWESADEAIHLHARADEFHLSKTGFRKSRLSFLKGVRVAAFRVH